MRIAVIGTGYVGLVAGVCFADAGRDVVCVDTDAGKVERMRGGHVPIYEPGLADLMTRAIREKRLSFTTSHAEAVRGAAVVFIAVGTPEGPTGEPDLRYVDAAVTDVAKALDAPGIVVLKSTVPVGTAKRVRALLARHARHPVSVVNNPEFLKEGAAVEDFLRPDRVVVGTDDDAAFETMRALYEPFVRTGKPILRMSNESAELTKYASNAMLATRVSFMNEVARLCDAVGADVEDVRRGMGSDSRIGSAFLFAGCGYGGSCFPKDTQGLIHVGKAHRVEMRIAQAVEGVNDEQKRLLVERVKERFGADLRGRRFALWGLAFKPRTDDVREAPAIEIARGLLDAGAQVVATDPEALETMKVVLGDRVRYVADPYEALVGADALLVVTEWNEYRGVDLDRVRRTLKTPVILDGRNVFDPARMRALGFEYRGIGRP
ncbi:MAG: UDP-glucose/GDP-mannose dehydrogenase family protein [Planctomycetes bacterium]|nr:UDP-glucose/GDP-mannose dehydrogenase family protein [Planctomycetota bacterium]